MSGNGSTLLIISGYNFDQEDQALPSIQSQTTGGTCQEFKYPSISRLAAAVTLANGSVFVTGGRGSEHHVWSQANSMASWSRNKDLLHGRKGHASIAVMVDGKEVVLVAGGWDNNGHELATMNLYYPGNDQWSREQSMPNPRVDFDLHVSKQSYYL